MLDLWRRNNFFGEEGGREAEEEGRKMEINGFLL